MGTFLILIVCLSFITAILTAGREGDYKEE